VWEAGAEWANLLEDLVLQQSVFDSKLQRVFKRRIREYELRNNQTKFRMFEQPQDKSKQDKSMTR
jgi:hypothetical protein